jgi:two-component system chemotaxis response regulator CheY
MNILIAEDDEGFQAMLRELLSLQPDMAGYFAKNGTEAWWLLTDPALKFDVALIDVRMPGVGGVDLLRRIRATPSVKGLPVILTTGLNDIQPVAEAAAMTITHYLVKPYRALDLLKIIRGACPATGTV